ncbi:hypothetical protein VNI00_014556 [Paramarasmius palmivorus]|uniref:Uncharacterized protein n=1 Tax=Paramarasmius palmivorus TaxID=297713 RepID=A0AAW0BSC9_9AGAR
MSDFQIPEAQVLSILERIDEDNFFQQIIALDPHDPDFVEDVEAAERALIESGFAKSGWLKIGAAKGWLVWHLSGRVGRAKCPKTGAGGFGGADLPSGLTGGQFELYLSKDDRLRAKLDLSPKGGAAPTNWKGTGTQKGLSNREGQPWTGSYN